MSSGRVNSIQSLGTLDGPGVRFVVFLQGCNLRCGCCHNPDTWEINGGESYTAEEIVNKALRFKEYFGNGGGITLSGGEPLLQADFAYDIFDRCKRSGINTCLDTSGSVLNGAVKKLLKKTDRVLLDLKYTKPEYYKRYVGCEMDRVLAFLDYLEKQKIPTTLRQVIIPTLNNSENDVLSLKFIAKEYPCVDKIELLPFKKICQTKYDNMGIEFPFSNIPTPNLQEMRNLEEVIK